MPLNVEGGDKLDLNIDLEMIQTLKQSDKLENKVY